MIACTISMDNARGLRHGRDDLVGIGCTPITFAFLTHLLMVPGDTPKRRAVTLTPFLTAIYAASLRTLGWCGSCVYMPFILHVKCFQAIEPLRIVDYQTILLYFIHKFIYKGGKNDRDEALQVAHPPDWPSR